MKNAQCVEVAEVVVVVVVVVGFGGYSLCVSNETTLLNLEGIQRFW